MSPSRTVGTRPGVAVAALADIWQVQVRYRPLADSEHAAVMDLLDYASAKLRVSVPSIDTRIADGSLDPVLPAGVVVDAVVRVLRNRDTQVRDRLNEFDVDTPPGAAEWTSTIGFTQGEIVSVSPRALRSAGSVRVGSSIGYVCDYERSGPYPEPW